MRKSEAKKGPRKTSIFHFSHKGSFSNLGKEKQAPLEGELGSHYPRNFPQ
jgi:hypothetical protein